MGHLRRNLELKVACDPDDLAHRRGLLAAHEVAIVRHLYQRDVYVRVPSGRLKMRWIVEERDGALHTSAELIRYTRPDEAGSRWSAYSVEPISLDEVGDVETNLLDAHGVLAIVAKQRDIAHWGRTRIHLDEVEDLGCFIELETVLSDQSDEDATREHETVIRALQLDRLPVVAGSYSDLLTGSQPEEKR